MIDHRLKQDGYAVVKSVFQESEISQCRTIISDYLRDRSNHHRCSGGGIAIPDCFGYLPELRFLLDHSRLSDVIQSYCGSLAMLLPHHDIQMNRTSSWHKDTCDCKSDPWSMGPDGNEWQVFKCAIYLQRETPATRALTVRCGSHKSPVLGYGYPVAPPMDLGDILLFDQRISHQGQPYALKDKILRRLAFGSEPWRTRLTRFSRQLFGQPDRIAIFLSIGVPSDLTSEVVTRTIIRQLQENGEQQAVIDAMEEAFA